ncbi:MAG: hypothetical protein KIS67_03145 [Verrucomicrobiae bacterium]|nr:hypothetical protein [Verrucomicrobiae bacterium]
MNPRTVAADVRRRIPLSCNDVRFLTSAATSIGFVGSLLSLVEACIGTINLMWGRLFSLPVPRTFQSGVPRGDWKVARTGGQECPPYIERFMESFDLQQWTRIGDMNRSDVSVERRKRSLLRMAALSRDAATSRFRE